MPQKPFVACSRAKSTPAFVRRDCPSRARRKPAGSRGAREPVAAVMEASGVTARLRSVARGRCRVRIVTRTFATSPSATAGQERSDRRRHDRLVRRGVSRRQAQPTSRTRRDHRLRLDGPERRGRSIKQQASIARRPRRQGAGRDRQDIRRCARSKARSPPKSKPIRIRAAAEIIASVRPPLAAAGVIAWLPNSHVTNHRRRPHRRAPYTHSARKASATSSTPQAPQPPLHPHAPPPHNPCSTHYQPCPSKSQSLYRLHAQADRHPQHHAPASDLNPRSPPMQLRTGLFLSFSSAILRQCSAIPCARGRLLIQASACASSYDLTSLSRYEYISYFCYIEMKHI